MQAPALLPEHASGLDVLQNFYDYHTEARHRGHTCDYAQLLIFVTRHVMKTLQKCLLHQHEIYAFYERRQYEFRYMQYMQPLSFTYLQFCFC